jgi:hypothetical protein
MATYSSSATLTTGGGTITLNAGTGDTYWNDPTQCAGLDMAPIRSTVDDKPQTDGGIVHPMFFGARHITLGGDLVVRSSGTEAGYLAARAALEQNLIAALTSIMNADGTYSWDDGGTTRTVTVRCDQQAVIAGTWLKSYVFGLVAANPTIS